MIPVPLTLLVSATTMVPQAWPVNAGKMVPQASSVNAGKMVPLASSANTSTSMDIDATNTSTLVIMEVDEKVMAKIYS